MDFLFKVWSCNREKKTFVVLDDNQDDLYVQLILKSSEKLKIDGTKIVLEKDGTVVDDEIVLKLLNRETFILLTKDEVWKSANYKSHSTCSTDTVESCSSSYSTASLSTLSPSPQLSTTFEPLETHNITSSKVSQFTWEEFQIPWHQLNESVIQNCEKATRDSDCITKVVNVTVDAVREIKKFASTRTYKILAKKIIAKYTKQFRDIDDDGVVIGEGCYSLTSKLVDRNNYLNRPHKKPSNAVYTEIPPSKRKAMLSAKAGCSNWQPEIETLLPETLMEKKHMLNNYIRGNFTLNEETKQFLSDTYGMQRLFLNEKHSIEEVYKEWPVLLEKEVIFWHFEKLMSQDITDLQTRFVTKENRMFELAMQNKFTKVQSIPQEEDEKHQQCLQIVADYFKENLQFFINKMNENKRNVQPEINTPCILIETSSNMSNEYCVYVEKQEIIKCSNFMEAFKVSFSLYYNLNMCYPKQISNTLEFIQRYILKINPDQGTKSKKKSLNKVVSLINKLRSIV